MLALSLAFVGQAAVAAPRTWNGAAGGAAPFWDLAANWLEGLPTAGDAVALGAYDTAIRSGIWSLASLNGSALLSLTGGSLNLLGASSIGVYALGGGMAGGPGTLSAGQFAWSGGGLGNALSFGGTTHVAGSATLNANGHAVDYGHRLELGGNSTLAGNGQLYISGGGTVSGTPYGASSVALATGKTLVMQGDALTAMQIYGGGVFQNAGTVSKTGASSTLFIDSGFDNSTGTVNALAGEVQWRNTRTLAGTVNVSSGATLHFNGGTTLAPGLVLSNAGSVIFDGVYNLLAGGSLAIGGATTLAGGALGGAGTMTLSSLTWSAGTLGIAEFLGGATVVNGASSFSLNSHSIVFGHQLQLNGDSTWASSGQLFLDGAGNYSGTAYAASVLTVAAGRSLLLQGSGTGAFQIYGGGSFINAGVVAKASGSGTLFIDNVFSNSGTLRADAGLVQIRGTLDNTGTLHANGARIEISQPSGLVQWSGSTETLTGGSYRVTGAQPIALNLGVVAATGMPALIRSNQAQLMLEGSGASIDITTTSPPQSALSALSRNSGLLSLTGGAKLLTSAALANQAGGTVAVGAGSELQTAGAYAQDGVPSSTWIGGRLAAPSMSFAAGTLSAGVAALSVGSAVLDTGALSLGSSAVLAEDFAGATWDQITVPAGSVVLGGTLAVHFATNPIAGTYRFLTAGAGAITGTFAVLTSNLNASAYAVNAVYGINYVDLTVSAVSEPETGALMLSGLLLLGLRRAGLLQRPVLPTAG